MNSPHEHARALLARARDDLYVVRGLGGEPDAPEEFFDDEPPVNTPRFESVVTRTIDWASERLSKR